jgi:multicomponent Na+:H+ antiporter subunit B
MSETVIILSIVLAILVVVATFVLWLTKDLLVAVLASAVISLVSSIFFLILQVPDVAITEASIGAALTTGFFLFAMKYIGRNEDD